VKRKKWALIVVVGVAAVFILAKVMGHKTDVVEPVTERVAPAPVGQAPATPVAPVSVKKCWGTMDKSPAAVAGRVRFVEEKMPAAGLVKKTYKTSDGTARVVVTPAFMGLDFDDKKQFAGVLYAYHFDGCGSEILILVDSKSGKKVGVYGEGGLDLE